MQSVGGSTRRDILKKGAIGATAAWVAPTVLSVQGAAAQSAGGGILPPDPQGGIYEYIGPAPFFSPLTRNTFAAALAPRPFTAQQATLPASYAGISLLYIAGNTVVPSPTEMAALLAYVTGGGRVLIDSDFGDFSNLNNTANAILASLGVSMSYVSATLDIPCSTTTNVVPGPFSTGLAGLPMKLATTGDIAVASPAAVIVNGNSGQPLLAYQQLGSGVVFFTSDTQTFDDQYCGWPVGTTQLAQNLLS